MNLPLRIALRHLKTPQKAGFTRYAGVMAIVGLGLGIAALVLTFSILNGFERTLSNKLTEFDGHIRIEHFMDAPVLQNDPMLDSALSQIAVQFQSLEYIQKPAILRRGQQAEGVIVEAYSDFNEIPGLNTRLVSGNLNSGDGIIIGQELATKLDLDINDQLVLFDISNLQNVSSNRRMGQYEIIGIYHSGLQEYDETMVYIALSAAQRLFGMKDKVTGQVLFLTDVAAVGEVAQQLENYLGYPYFVLTWLEKHRILFEWLSVQKWPILIIFGMIALVGVVNIISALAMIVIEKIREIGILKSMGLSRKTIRKVFLIEGGIIGLAGSGGGALTAVLIAWVQHRFQILTIPEEVYFMDHVPVYLDIGTVSIFIVAGVVAALAASLWPTNKAAVINPAGAVRYE